MAHHIIATMTFTYLCQEAEPKYAKVISTYHGLWTCGLRARNGNFNGLCHKTEMWNPENTILKSLTDFEKSYGVHEKVTAMCLHSISETSTLRHKVTKHLSPLTASIRLMLSSPGVGGLWEVGGLSTYATC